MRQGLREQGLEWRVWLWCVSVSVCWCVSMYVSSRQQWVVSNTLPGIKHSTCGSDLTQTLLRNANSARLTDWSTDWSTAWLTHCLIDLTASCPSAVGFWDHCKLKEHWNVLVNKLWLHQCGTTTILMEFLSFESSIDEAFERTCWRTDWYKQHLKCINICICIYWTLTAERLFTKKSTHHFIMCTNSVSTVCKGISWLLL